MTTGEYNIIEDFKEFNDSIIPVEVNRELTPKQLQENIIEMSPLLGTLIKTYNLEQPNLKLSIYKNRRGQYKGIYLWCKADLGTCRINPMYATDWRYQFIDMDDYEIDVAPSAF